MSTAHCANTSCNNIFEVHAPNHLYCSPSCMIKAQRRRRKLRSKGILPQTLVPTHGVTDADVARILRVHQEVKQDQTKQDKEDLADVLQDVLGYTPRKADIPVDDTEMAEDEKRPGMKLEDI